MGNVNVTEVGPEQVLVYIEGNGPVTRFWHRKCGALRGFYRFAIGRGYATCSPLPKTLPKPAEVFTPYIYSPGELRRLLSATEQCVSARTKLEARTLHMLLLLLYGAGLRISEALLLRPQDVDLKACLLTIRESKFYKTRLVPVGEQLADALQDYVKERGCIGYPVDRCNTFFVTRSGEAVTRSMAERAFCRIRKAASVHRDDGARYQPRLHDLRHSFAVHRLIAWYREGADVQRLLPQLSTYLGHVHIAATQKYLTMTPELLNEASQRFERYARPEEIGYD
jgi:site-specific recombinase XerD